jgi:eukaryotic-like serine/threonine-protein kinase
VFAAWLAENGEIGADELRKYLVDADLHFSTVVAPAPVAQRLAPLGRGAMGEVFLARDRRLNRVVAVKQMDAKIAANPDLSRRFYTEAQVTAQLDHPAIVPVFNLEQREDGSIAYAMRVVRGRTLRGFLDETRAFYDRREKPDAKHQLQARLLLFEDLCRALHYAHARGVVHRDLKPDNVMVGPYGEVLVMDWGIAKILGQAERPLPQGPDGSAVEATEAGATLGTARYMSPEQAAGEHDTLDPRSDQYALGLILFELVSLKHGNQGPNSSACWLNAAAGRVAPLVHYAGEAIPRDLGAIIARATRPRAADRYPDVGALAEDVRRFLRDEELLARPDSLQQRVLRQVGRNRRLVAGTTAALAIALVVLAVGGLALGAAGFAFETWRASRREEALARLSTQVAQQARNLDTVLSGYAGEVRGLRGAAAFALTHRPDEERAVYFAEAFAGPPDGRPPDLAHDPAYDAAASLGFPDNVTAPDVDRGALAERLQQLQALQPEMRSMLERSGGTMIWTYVATEEGILTGMPGVGEYPPRYDPRGRTWYTVALASPGVAWDVSDDESGQGLLLTASSAVRDPAGRALGVAALDLGVDHVTRELLAPQGLAARAALVDRSGRVLVDTADADAARTRPAFAYAEVVAASRAGWREVDDALVLWSPVDQLGWTYVVVGDAGALLDVW